jgi:hypothetical protein
MKTYKLQPTAEATTLTNPSHGWSTTHARTAAERLKPSTSEGFRRYPRTEREIHRSSETLLHGFGINDSAWLTTTTNAGRASHCAAFRTWRNAIGRCYSAVVHKSSPSYEGCSVSPEWKRFSEFEQWYSEQRTTGNQLDKDIILPGNKVYSPLTCMMVPSHINALFTSSNGRGALPRGVDIACGKRKKSFRAQLDIGGKRVTLGYFMHAKDAENCYATARAELIRSTFSGLRGEDPRLIPALERIAATIIGNLQK